MTVAYYRDMDTTDRLIFSTSEGIYSLDVSTLRVGSAEILDKVPANAVAIGLTDVGRILTIASTRAIKRCEDGMEGSE